MPAIFANGAVIATFTDKKQLWCENTDNSIKEVIIDYFSKNPESCIIVSSDNKDYIYNLDFLKSHVYSLDGFNIVKGKIKDIKKPLIKTVIISENNLLDFLNNAYSSYLDRLYFTKSGDNFYEIMSKRVSKGNALDKLKQLSHISDKKIIAVGDNYNDIEFIVKADVGVAVKNNCEELINKADILIEKNDVIYKLINKLS